MTKTTKKAPKKVQKKVEPKEETNEEQTNEAELIEEQEIAELKQEEKPKKQRKVVKEQSTFSRILNIFLWIILFAWMAVCLVDFFRVRNEKTPVFCISKDTIKYDDGNVKVCLGLGYKVYDYNRDSYEAIEFGPFWSTDRSEQKDK